MTRSESRGRDVGSYNGHIATETDFYSSTDFQVQCHVPTQNMSLSVLTWH